jgi:acetyl esterase
MTKVAGWRFFLPALLPFALLNAAEVHKDVEYARPDNVSLKLDVSVPNTSGPHPAIILVHGGAFVEGTRYSGLAALFRLLSDLDLVVFTIDYRLAPQYTYPAAIEDVEAAIRWVRSNAARYKADPDRLALLGQSAGGYLASMAVARAKPGCEVSAAVLFYPISDVVRTFDRQYTSQTMRADRSRFFGVLEVKPENASFLREASPHYNLRSGMPPYLLLHGTADKRVDHAQSVALCEKLTALGNRCELISVINGGHGGWKDLAWKGKLLSWLSEQLRLDTVGRH